MTLTAQKFSIPAHQPALPPIGQLPRLNASAVEDARAKPALDRGPAFANALAVIRRVEDYIDDETRGLAEDPAFDLASSNNRKSQGLVDLNRAVRALAGSEYESAIQGPLVILREKLDRNLAVIRMHLSAVKEVSEVLSNAIQNADSDGTYTPAIRTSRNVP
jgi:hypothetical protein